MNRILRRALLSVSDKTGIVPLARSLHEFGIELVSTGGTAAAIRAEGLEVVDVSSLTGVQEFLEGRVKTLHPRIHGALLADPENPAHLRDMQSHGIVPIDLLVVNLYPFGSSVAVGASFKECIEQIDIGGPAMIRAAAKNHGAVAVLIDPEDYSWFVEELRTHAGAATSETRKRLAAKAFARTALYDAEIANWLNAGDGFSHLPYFVLGGTLASVLRYGENPHQSAAFYALGGNRSGIAAARQVQGKELSYNNIADADSAWSCLGDLDQSKPACVIVKHANPCGAAYGESPTEAYMKALACDPVSAFGGIVAMNTPIDRHVATEIVKIFTEVIIATAASDEALAVIAEKSNLRLLLVRPDPGPAGAYDIRTVSGGILVQRPDDLVLAGGDFRCVTRRAPSPQEIADMKFAFAVAKHVKSNAVVFAKNFATVGIGAGQMSRLDAVRIAVGKATLAEGSSAGKGEHLAGSVVASDAFFPFVDGLEAAADAGATAVIQPGGSLKDAEVIAAADHRGLAMVFTGVRHFRH